jgi:hypothetical protein
MLTLAQAAPAPTASVVSQFLQAGLLGACCVVLAVVILALWRDNKALNTARIEDRKAHETALVAAHQKRIDDAKEINAQQLAVNRECITALSNVAQTLDAIRASFTELRDEFRDETRRPARR